MQVKDVFDIITELKPLEKTEQITLENALNRVLASDIIATKNLPSFDNSALDGYAFDFNEREIPLKVAGVVFAGDNNTYKLNKGETFKIMTGAAFPKGANSVVAVEDALFDEKGYLLVPKETKENNARKITGEELKKGQLILKSQTRLNAAHIMLLASQGIHKIKVFKKPKIALLCSGSEIKEPWQKAKEKEVYNSNASGVLALLSGYECEYLGALKDDKTNILATLKTAFKSHDFIITTGGASKGDADYMCENLLNLDFEPLFDKINFRPAKPTKLFKKDSKIALVLPGNPLSCFVACFLFALPIIKRLENDQNPLQPCFDAILASELTLNATRDNLVIGTYENGVFYPYNEGKFSPSQIMPLVRNNAIAVFEKGISHAEAKKIIKIFKIS